MMEETCLGHFKDLVELISRLDVVVGELITETNRESWGNRHDLASEAFLIMRSPPKLKSQATSKNLRLTRIGVHA